MKSLFLKEIAGFFSSITGYIVIIVFLVINGLFLWIFPGEMNVLDSGYATLDTLFVIAPWVFLFLIPAITMRSFADEQRSGNLELLLTRPLNDLQIVLAKFFANCVVALLSILPTLVFFLAVQSLSVEGQGMDPGATWGSYTGLLLLASVYCSIGIFASSLTENSIIAFILAVGICFFLYIGFNSVGYLSPEGTTGNFIINLGIDAHYRSMQRGVIDSRDLLYFISVIIIFIYATRIRLRSRNW